MAAAPPPISSAAEARSFATAIAIADGIDVVQFVDTLSCESQGFTVLSGQSQVPNPAGPNGQENSWGVAQFNLPSDLKTADGRPIDFSVATDPRQAISAAAYNFSLGKQGRWSCWRLGEKRGWSS